MGNYCVKSGVLSLAQKVVIYGPEGIGKSTFASRFPDPVFIDTEGGSAKLDVSRMPRPSSWAMLLDEVEAIRRGDIVCGTIVIDTADWAERLCIRAVCAAHKWDGIEAPGYGKGYAYVREEFGKLLDTLEETKNAGVNVVITAHAQISKFELPDEMGQYDRWSMKTSKLVAPLLREWCDMLLFANYKTFVVKDGDGKNAKGKAQGGQRVMYTTHHACWDAKNRDGLPEECPFDFSVIAEKIPRLSSAPAQEQAAKAKSAPEPSPRPAPEAARAPTLLEEIDSAPMDAVLETEAVPAALRPLLKANNIFPDQVQRAVFLRGCYPEDVPIRSYDKDLLGNLVAKWPQWLTFIQANCDALPF